MTGASEDLTLSSVGGSVNIDGSEAAANAIYLNASNAAGGIDIDSGTGGFIVDTTGAFSLDAGAASNLTTSAGALTITSAAAATWSTTAGLLTMHGEGGILATTGGNTNLTLRPGGTGDVILAADNDANDYIQIDLMADDTPTAPD